MVGFGRVLGDCRLCCLMQRAGRGMQVTPEATATPKVCLPGDRTSLDQLAVYGGMADDRADGPLSCAFDCRKVVLLL